MATKIAFRSGVVLAVWLSFQATAAIQAVAETPASPVPATPAPEATSPTVELNLDRCRKDGKWVHCDKVTPLGSLNIQIPQDQIQPQLLDKIPSQQK